MEAPALDQETVHGNYGLQKYLTALALYSQNLSTGYIKGNKWYVDPAKGGDGKSWEEAAATIGAILSVADHNDAIFLAPGRYTITEKLLIEQNYLKILAATGIPGVASVPTVIEGSGVDSMGIDSVGVEIAGITFEGAEGYWCVDVPGSNDSNPSGIWLHHNYFYAHEQGSVKGVSLGNREAGGYGNAISGVVEDNWFFKCGGVSLNLDASRGAVRRNTFFVMHANTAAILCPQSGSQRNSNEILNNRFVAYGTANEQKGIVFSGATSPTVGTMLVDGNRFINFASATLAVNKLAGYGGVNYFNDQFLTAANPPVATNRYA